MLVVPHAHDQGDNAVRAARRGVARVLFPSQYARRTVRDHLRALLSEVAYRRQATAVAAAVRAEGGAERAAVALEALAGGTGDGGRGRGDKRPGFFAASAAAMSA